MINKLEKIVIIDVVQTQINEQLFKRDDRDGLTYLQGMNGMLRIILMMKD